MAMLWKVFGTPSLDKTIKRLEDCDTSLTEVHCDGTAVTRESLKRVLEALKKGPIGWILSFRLSRCGASESGLLRVMKVIEMSKALTTFELEWCNLQNRGASSVCKSLEGIPSLTKVSLAGNDLTATEPFVSLLSNSSVRMLNLSNNKFGAHGDEEVLLLAEALKKNQLLTILDLANNDIGMEFVDALTDIMFQENFTLTDVKLHGNIKISRIEGSLLGIEESLVKNRREAASRTRGIEAHDATETPKKETPTDPELLLQRQREQERFDTLPLEKEPKYTVEDLEVTIKHLRAQLAKNETELDQVRRLLDKEVEITAQLETDHQAAIEAFMKKLTEQQHRHENQMEALKVELTAPTKKEPSALVMQLAEEHCRMNRMDGSFRESLKGSFMSDAVDASDSGKYEFHQELDTLLTKAGNGAAHDHLCKLLNLIDRRYATFFESQVRTMSSEINTIMAHKEDIDNEGAAKDGSDKDLRTLDLEQKPASLEAEGHGASNEDALQALKLAYEKVQKELGDKVSTLKGRLALKEKANTELVAKENENLSTISKLRKELSEMTAAKEKLDGTVTRLTASLEQEGAKVTEMMSRVEELKGALEARDVEVTKLQTELAESQGTLADLTSAKKTLEKAKTQLELELHSFIKESDSKRDKLDRKLKDKEASVAALSGKMKAMQELNEQMQSQIRKFQKEEENYLTEIEEMRKARKQFDNDMKDLQKTLIEQQEEFSKQAAEKDEKIQELEGQLQTQEAINRAEQQDAESSSTDEDELEDTTTAEWGISRKDWVKSAGVKSCGKCSNKFTFKNRKHHCRRCGNVYCGKCCSASPLTDNVRVCIDCNAPRQSS